MSCDILLQHHYIHARHHSCICPKFEGLITISIHTASERIWISPIHCVEGGPTSLWYPRECLTLIPYVPAPPCREAFHYKDEDGSFLTSTPNRKKHRGNNCAPGWRLVLHRYERVSPGGTRSPKNIRKQAEKESIGGFHNFQWRDDNKDTGGHYYHVPE